MTFAINEPAIRCRGMCKSFPGRGAALDGFDLTVDAGTVHGLLGPNGAGKTTAVRILSTLQRFDSGQARVAGCDVASDPAGVRARIGVAGQYAAVDEVLTGRANLEMFGRLNHLRARAARQRAIALLERFDLKAAADRPVRQYSGGMRRRLDLAISLIRNARVLFLDEPSTGLDPRSRNEVWDAVRELAASGTTVLLTTQYLEEADRLCARISVLDGGRVVAEGSPSELKARIGGSRAEVAIPNEHDLALAASHLSAALGVTPETDPATRRISIPLTAEADSLARLARGLDDAGLGAGDITVRRPDLDEVFLHLTDRSMPKEAAR